MPTVSLSFLLTICAIAAWSGLLSVVAPNPVFGVTAVLLGLYGVHGLALRFAIRERGDPQELQRERDVLQAELEQQKVTLEEERAERFAVEREWIGVPTNVQTAPLDRQVH